MKILFAHFASLLCRTPTIVRKNTSLSIFIFRRKVYYSTNSVGQKLVEMAIQK